RKGGGLMNTMENDTFDYQTYIRETPPDPAKILRGTADRRQRFDAAMMRLTVRINEDTLQQFHQLAVEGQSCEQLINQALREWLAARDMKELIRAEIQRAVQQSLASAQIGGASP
ncbi:MAG: hypothetical protein ACREAB_12470, partial [Blastocatellia bacterium]